VAKQSFPLRRECTTVLFWFSACNAFNFSDLCTRGTARIRYPPVKLNLWLTLTSQAYIRLSARKCFIFLRPSQRGKVWTVCLPRLAQQWASQNLPRSRNSVQIIFKFSRPLHRGTFMWRTSALRSCRECTYTFVPDMNPISISANICSNFSRSSP
jgi:hypothetical protein